MRKIITAGILSDMKRRLKAARITIVTDVPAEATVGFHKDIIQ